MKGLSFVIYRIIGNSLPPRHGPDETCENLQFSLENESDFPSCDKRWLLNRLVDPAVEAKCIKLIRASGQKYHTIPLDEASYKKTFLDASGMPKHLNPFAAESAGKPSSGAAKEWILRHKSLIAINLNNARNWAIELGRADALWTLPLDGWSYFTDEAWDRFVEGVAQNVNAFYGILPLARLKDNAHLGNMTTLPEPTGEPQIAFRRDAPDRFNEKLRYGNQNKTELLTRLGMPGVWKKWNLAYWDTTPRLEAIAPGRFFVGGWVYRLASHAGDSVEISTSSRFVARIDGVQRFVHQLDTAFMQKFLGENRGYDYCVLQPGSAHSHPGEVQALLGLAEAAMKMPIRTVLDKTEIPASGNKNDYFSPPRYVHDIDGNNIRIDGRPAETSNSGPLGSHRHDRGALRECFSHAAILAASGVLCQSEDFLGRSAKILAAWFIDRDTSMNPSARFAQWKSDSPATANFAGLIDFRYLWTLPYLSRTLLANGALSEPQFEAIKQWAASFLGYITETNQGQRAVMATNNIGTWLILVVVSLSLFTGKFETAAAPLSTASLRLAAQCDVIGLQTGELSRTRPLHYSFFNLTAWILLANLGRSAGFDLWNYRGVEGQSICRMMHFIQTNMTHFQEYQDQPAKYVDWFDALLLLVPPTAADRPLLVQHAQETDRNWTDDPDLGLPSQWRFFLPLYS
ncbi:MAG: alginate lyase family protein [Aestuariivirga sp.]